MIPGRGVEAAALAVVAGVAGLLLFAQLGSPYLWQDEAQTALISKTVLSGGVPRGTDGRNFFSQELGIEYGDGYLWRWHTWLPFYLVAGSFRALGVTTTAARAPFALAGLATVLLTYLAARALWRDGVAGLCAAGLLALSVPFLVLCRQARWYALAACFSLLGLHCYRAVRPGTRLPTLGLLAAGTLLFHTHYLYCATLLVALLLHAALLERAKLAPVARASLGVALLALPWVWWLASAPYGANYGERLADLGQSLDWAWVLVRRLFEHAFSPLWLAAPLLLWIRARRRGEPPPRPARETWSGLALIALFGTTTVVALALLAPGPYFRYLTPLIPPLFLVAGLLLGALLRRSRALAVALLAVWLATGRLSDFVYELRHDFDGPIEGIVTFLEQHASPDETVAISYGDMPLKFYTHMRVLGGPTGEDLSGLGEADWIVLRRHVNEAPVYRRVREALVAELSPERFDRFEIDYPDTPFENREDPDAHRFRSAEGEARVQIFRRKR